jgi:hypothetical protein
MALRLHVDPPEGQSYSLPATADRSRLEADLAELGEKRWIVVEIERSDDPRGTGTLYINAANVISAVLSDVPDELDLVAPDGSDPEGSDS